VQYRPQPCLPPELKAQVDLDNNNFVSNDRLLEVMQRTTATPAQVAEATRINTEAGLQALKIGFLLMAGLALLALFPAGRLPEYTAGDLLTQAAGTRDVHATPLVRCVGLKKGS
jgi:hypothetical protein